MQKTEEFNSSVYSALDQISSKLQDTKRLQAVKMTYFIQDGDTLIKTPSHHTMIQTNDEVTVVNKSQSVQSKTIVKLRKTNKEDVLHDSILIGDKDGQIHVVLNGSKSQIKLPRSNKFFEEVKKTFRQSVSDSEELRRLVNKMSTEIIVMDSEINDHAVAEIIDRILVAKGIQLPFEFSLQKEENKKIKKLAQSWHFSDKIPSFKRDLSLEKIIHTQEYLYLQFPDQRDLVLAGMKNSLILTLVFSLVILALFFYVMRLILQQKKLGEIKNDFVNNMTHELKTPIATISLAIDAMNNEQIKNSPSRYAEYTRILKEENNKLNTHVERVLQMALLDKGELPLRKEKVDLSEIIQMTLRAYHLQIEERGAKVEFIPPKENIILMGDVQHLLTAFSNLLDNALKYSDQHCCIHISITKKENVIVLRIKDDGIGMSKANKEKIFEKFFRAQGGSVHDVKGFGIGLSYVKSIVEAHNGIIDVLSEEGKGSEFILTFKSDA